MIGWQRSGLLTIIGGLAGLIALEVIRGTNDPSPPLGPRAPVAAPQHGYVGTGNESVAELAGTILARPLFSPDRRPARSSLAPSANADQVMLPRLSGVIVSGAHHLAIFAGSKDGKPIVVVAGQTVGDWSVKAIESDGVVLTDADGSQKLHPAFGPTATETARPPVAPPPDPASVATEAARRALLARLND